MTVLAKLGVDGDATSVSIHDIVFNDDCASIVCQVMTTPILDAERLSADSRDFDNVTRYS